MKARSFAPLSGRSPRILICGTMPGLEALRRRQFYGHPRNLFWRLIGEVLGRRDFEGRTYSERCKELKRKGIALWDVLKSCQRKGSLDSNIKNPVPTPIPEWVHKRPSLRLIAFTGKAAENLFRRFHPDFVACSERPRAACAPLPLSRQRLDPVSPEEKRFPENPQIFGLKTSILRADLR